ncbi:MAG: cysteine--tRNA ligase [Pseudomonadota bacterium]
MTEIRLYNTRTRSKEAFNPIDRANVRMYACGPTVYDRAHIGNARPVVVFDVLFRLLRYVYGDHAVTYVRNFTDVDDKINEKSRATGRSIRDITDETIGWYHEDMDALGALRPSQEPRCTEFIQPMVAMGEQLIEMGFAYEAQGHVLFSVDSYDRYGALSGRSVEDMIAGARVEVAPYKRNPMDFVIWKPSGADQPGWDSPWGRGRPGWHVECSAMAKELLGDVFDIHAGGIDLQFPHHENELAQSCCVHGTDRMANVWMHNEMIRVEGQKMAKSLGNFVTVKDLLHDPDCRYPGIDLGPAIRFRMLQTHYRKPLDWTAKSFEDAIIGLDKFRHVLPSSLEVDRSDLPQINKEGFIDAIADDLNLAAAFAIMHRTADRLKRSGKDADAVTEDQALLFQYLEIVGISPADLATYDLSRMSSQSRANLQQEMPDTADLILQLIAERDVARKSKDFARADAIRDGFAAAGVVVKDMTDGASWEVGPAFDPAKLEALR